MTLQEAATLLGLSPDTLRWQVRNGRLKARKVGRDWHVTPQEVGRYRRDHLRFCVICGRRDHTDHDAYLTPLAESKARQAIGR